MNENKIEIWKIKEDFVNKIEPLINKFKWVIELHELIKYQNEEKINRFDVDQLRRNLGKKILGLRQYLKLELPYELKRLLENDKSVELFELYFNRIVDWENEMVVKNNKIINNKNK